MTSMHQAVCKTTLSELRLLIDRHDLCSSRDLGLLPQEFASLNKSIPRLKLSTRVGKAVESTSLQDVFRLLQSIDLNLAILGPHMKIDSQEIAAWCCSLDRIQDDLQLSLQECPLPGFVADVSGSFILVACQRVNSVIQGIPLSF